MSELVSIIVPVYNEKRFFADCIKSLLSQSYKNIEVVIVDDGSDRETASLCDHFSSIDNRVSVIHKKNEGLSSARITGLNNAKGSWVFFSDHDDIVDQNAIEQLAMHIGEDIDIVSGKRIDFTGEQPIKQTKEFSGEFLVLSGDEAIERIPSDNQENIITPLWGKIYRKDFLQSVDLLKYKNVCPIIYFEDVLATPIIFHFARKIAFLNKVVYYHREVPTSISRSGRISEFYIDQVKSGAILLDFVKQNSLLTYYEYEINIYIKSIIRIWSLISIKDKKRQNNIKKEIRMYFKKYFKECYKNSSCVKKTFLLAFYVCPHVVKIGVKIYIFNKRKRNR